MATLGTDLLPALDRTWETLEGMCNKDPVMMQKIIELMAVRHCGKMGTETGALLVAKHVHRHIEQLLRQLFERPVA
jgi:hypothetical protein